MAQQALANTFNVTPSSNLQSAISGASAGDTVAFAAGSYTVSSALNLKCGVTYTGPVATPATAVLTSTAGTVFSLTSNCPQQTEIEYFNFKGNATGIYVQTPFSNLLVQYNQFTYIPGSQNQTTGMYFQVFNGANNQNAVLTSTTITHNQFGDANSCTSPYNVMRDTDSPEDYEGACNGLVFQTSINGLTVSYNNFNHVAEGAHINCPNLANQVYPCEPPGGAITQNILVAYNDFNNIHRIVWEEQAQQSSGIQFINNDEHDWVTPYFGSFGLSMACCYNGTLAQPNLTVTGNVVVFNVAPGANLRYGYGFEAMGNQAVYNNNYLGSNAYTANATYGPGPGMAFGCGPVASMSNNTVVGNSWGGYLVTEGISNGCADNTPSSFTGNVTGTTLAAITSIAPAISPASGTYGSSPTVVLTDAGYTSGPQPLGNTSIWYTTDGSLPVPGSGTAQLYTAPFTVSLPSTVKAVGMWGAANQPTSYPAGYGFVPSAAVTASYAGSSGPATQSVTLTAVSVSGSGPSLLQGSTMQMIATCTYSDGSTTNCNTGDAHGNAVSAWSSSSAVVTVSASGLASGVSAGMANITATVAGVVASPWAITVTPPVVALTSVSLSATGSVYSIVRGASIQMIASCNYSDGSTTNCSTADSHGNAVSTWSSSNTTAVTITASGIASAIAAGATTITATVAGLTASAWPLTVTTPALSSVALGTSTASLTVGATNQLQGTCSYADGSTTNCTTTDVNGNQVSSWTSSAPSVATVSSGGLVTAVAAGAANLIAMVTPATASGQWGQPLYDALGETYPSYINATYMVLGNQAGGYAAATCSFYLPPGTLTVGSLYDCGLVSAPTPTTQAAAWQCWYTYTVTAAASPGGWVTGPLSNCGTLAAGSAWWVSVVTNQPGSSPAGFYDCGGSCAGSAPASGSGTYTHRYIAAPYGVRSGMNTAMLPGSLQAAQYVTLGQPGIVSNTVPLTVTPAVPKLASITISAAYNVSTVVKGGTVQYSAVGVYSDGSTHLLPDAQGDAVTLWNTSNHAIAKMSTLGHLTALATGTVTVTAAVGQLYSAPLAITVTAAPATASANPTADARVADSTEVAGQTPQAPGPPMADAFAGPLWLVTAPAGGSASISQGNLFLGVPGGSNHDPLSGQDDAVRVLQPIGDENFDVSIKIASPLAAADASTSQGLMVVGDDRNYLTFSLDTDGTSIGLSLHSVTNRVATAVFSQSDLAAYQKGMYLRLTREGSSYTAFYSVDGQDWIQATNFHLTMTPTAVGPFAANFNDVPVNALPVVMSVNSFEAR